MLKLLLEHELLLLKRSPVFWLTLLLLPILIGTALYQGQQRQLKQLELQQTMRIDAQENLGELLAAVAEEQRTGISTPGHADPGSPSSVGRSLLSNYAYLLAAPLGILAVGQSDILPTTTGYSL
ncbi:MAG: hypothetical protein HC821_00765 [Lewinella sp.]|nr:hypothetical protein [Lewinella sp.]